MKTDRDADDVFLRNVGDELVGGSDGPWTTGISESLSSPKLVINCTTPAADALGDLDRDRDDDILNIMSTMMMIASHFKIDKL